MGINVTAGRDAEIQVGGDIVGGDKIVDLGLDPLWERLAVIRKGGSPETAKTAHEVEQALLEAQEADDRRRRNAALERALDLARKTLPALVPLIVEALRRAAAL